MSEIPRGWTLLSLGDIGRWGTGGTPSRTKPHFFGTGIPWIKSGDLPDGPIRSTEEQITPPGLENSSAKRLPIGTVSMALYGATIGKLGILTFEATTNQACANVIPHSNVVETGYLFNYLLSQRDAFIKQGQGGAQPNISQGIVRSHPIPVPPLTEQRRIVAKLEELFSELDAGVAALRRAQRRLTRYRQALLHAAVTGELTREWREQQTPDIKAGKDDAERPGWLPVGWDWTTIGGASEVSGGLTKNSRRSDMPKRLPYLRVANVYADELRLEEVEEIGIQDGELNRALLKPGDLLIVEGNGSLDQIGRVAIWDGSVEPCVHQNHIIKARVSGRVLPRFALLWLLSPLGRNAIVQQASSTSGLHTLSLSKVSGLPLPIPPIPEQEAIIAEYDRRNSLAQALGVADQTSLRRAERLRQSILERAFRGELVPQDPNDEPAETLLARLKAAAPATPAVRSRGRAPKPQPAEPPPPRHLGRPRKPRP